MRLVQVVGFISSVTGYTAYPIEFPLNTKREDILVVDIINGNQKGGSVTELNIQIMTRSNHPSTAEELANTLLEALHNQTKNNWDGWQIILIQANNPNPFFNGKDENNNYIYTCDFRLLIST